MLRNRDCEVNDYVGLHREWILDGDADTLRAASFRDLSPE